MLEIVDNFHFIKVLDKGGRHKPWLVRALTTRGYEDYVVKIFDQENEFSDFPTASEVYGSILAREFDLPTPEIVLVSVD